MNMKKIYALFISLIIFFSASAQWTQIKHSTLEGTVEYNGIVYTGSSVVMATNGGILRSTDNGVTWNFSVEGLDTLNLSVNNIAFIAERNELWICSNGNVFKSVDHGVSWNKVNLTGLSTGWTNQLGRVGNRLIIYHSVWDNVQNKNINSLAYSDDGSNWTKGPVIDDSGNNIYFEFVNEHNNKWLLFVEESGSSSDILWYTTDGTAFSSFPLSGLSTDIEIDVEDLSIDPAGDNLFIIDRDALAICWFNTASDTWEEKMTGIEGEGLSLQELFSIHSLGDITFASALFTDESSNILIKFYSSNDFGLNWTEITAPGVELPTFEGGTMIKAGSNRLIGSYFNNLMAYSDDAGLTWTKISQVYGGDYDYLVTLSDGTIFARAPGETKGLIKSTDNGISWTIQNGDLTNFEGMLYFIDAIWPGGPTTMYLTLRENPFDEKQYLYKSINSGVNWTKVTTAPDSYYKIFIGNYGAGNPIIWFGEEDGSGTYQFTTDGGDTWVDLTNAIDDLGIDKVMGIKGNGSLMILFGQISDRIHVYISEDDGYSFSDITGTLEQPNYEIIVADRWYWGKQPTAISSFSSDGLTFILAAKDNTTYPNKIVFFKLNSTMDGWEEPIVSGIEFPYDVEWHALKQIQGVWYFVTPAGVYASIDNCASWLRVWNNQGLTQGLFPRSFAAGNNMLFMGTEDAGLWTTPIYKPEIITNDATEINEESAKSGGAITGTGGLPFINKGLCWATHTTPTISDNKLSAGNSWSDFIATITDLTPNTTYYVRAFAENPIGLAYGNEISFKTQIASMIETESIKELVVYPNPATDVLNIRTEREGEALMLDITGRQVLREALFTGTNRIMVDKLTAGIYILKIKYQNGDVKTMRVVIK